MISAPGGRRTSLVHASLSICHPPADAGGRLGGQITEVRFQFNPDQLQLSHSASWNAQQTAAYERAVSPEFTGSQPKSLEVEVFLDGAAKPSASKVRQQVESLLSCCDVDPTTVSGNKPSPPWVRFSWGSFKTVDFVAYVERVSATFSLFAPTGEPLRATCQISMTEIPQGTKGQNPTSGSRTAQRSCVAATGDTLASLAWAEYGDPTVWRVIADANDIDDPTRLHPGQELLLPGLETTYGDA